MWPCHCITLYTMYIYVVNEIMILFYALTFSSFLFWFTSHGVPPFHIHLPWNHFPLRWHGSIWRHVPKTEAICPKVRLWAAVPLHCKRPKKKTATNSKFCIDWKRSSKIYAMWKVQRLLSSSKSKFGIFPILEAHTSFVDSHWNRRHVQRRCLGALNPPSNRWERCSIHRSI